MAFTHCRVLGFTNKPLTTKKEKKVLYLRWIQIYLIISAQSNAIQGPNLLIMQ